MDIYAVLLTIPKIKAGHFIYCHAVPHDSLQALAEEHFKDCLSNVFTLITISLSRFPALLIDRIGVIIISIVINCN